MLGYLERIRGNGYVAAVRVGDLNGDFGVGVVGISDSLGNSNGCVYIRIGDEFGCKVELDDGRIGYRENGIILLAGEKIVKSRHVVRVADYVVVLGSGLIDKHGLCGNFVVAGGECGKVVADNREPAAAYFVNGLCKILAFVFRGKVLLDVDFHAFFVEFYRSIDLGGSCFESRRAEILAAGLAGKNDVDLGKADFGESVAVERLGFEIIFTALGDALCLDVTDVKFVCYRINLCAHARKVFAVGVSEAEFDTYVVARVGGVILSDGDISACGYGRLGYVERTDVCEIRNVNFGSFGRNDLDVDSIFRLVAGIRNGSGFDGESGRNVDGLVSDVKLELAVGSALFDFVFFARFDFLAVYGVGDGKFGVVSAAYGSGGNGELDCFVGVCVNGLSRYVLERNVHVRVVVVILDNLDRERAGYAVILLIADRIGRGVGACVLIRGACLLFLCRVLAEVESKTALGGEGNIGRSVVGRDGVLVLICRVRVFYARRLVTCGVFERETNGDILFCRSVIDEFAREREGYRSSLFRVRFVDNGLVAPLCGNNGFVDLDGGSLFIRNGYVVSPLSRSLVVVGNRLVGNFVSPLRSGIELHGLVVVELDFLRTFFHGGESVVVYVRFLDGCAGGIDYGDYDFNALVGLVRSRGDRKSYGGVDACRGRNAAYADGGSGVVRDGILNLDFVGLFDTLGSGVEGCDVFNESGAFFVEFAFVIRADRLNVFFGDDGYGYCSAGVIHPLAVFVVESDFSGGKGYLFARFDHGRNIRLGNAKFDFVRNLAENLESIGKRGVCGGSIFNNIVTEHLCGEIGDRFARRIGHGRGKTGSRGNGERRAVFYGFGWSLVRTERNGFRYDGGRGGESGGNVPETADAESDDERKRTKSCK